MFPFLHFGSLAIPTYYLVISVTVCFALVWLKIRLRESPLPDTIAMDLSLVLMIASFVGARLFHVLYENPEVYLATPARVFYFWDGGFVFYGGALLSALCAVIYLRKKDPENFWSYFDLFAPVLAISYALGRIGCLLAGCCYGRTCELPWSIAGRHPTALYATFWEMGVVMILLGLESQNSPLKRSEKLQGSVFFVWMILHGLGRLVMEAFRDDFRGPTWGLSVSSWISIAIVALGLGLLGKKLYQGKTSGPVP